MQHVGSESLDQESNWHPLRWKCRLLHTEPAGKARFMALDISLPPLKPPNCLYVVLMQNAGFLRVLSSLHPEEQSVSTEVPMTMFMWGLNLDKEKNDSAFDPLLFCLLLHTALEPGQFSFSFTSYPTFSLLLVLQKPVICFSRCAFYCINGS